MEEWMVGRTSNWNQDDDYQYVCDSDDNSDDDSDDEELFQNSQPSQNQKLLVEIPRGDGEKVLELISCISDEFEMEFSEEIKKVKLSKAFNKLYKQYNDKSSQQHDDLLMVLSGEYINLSTSNGIESTEKVLSEILKLHIHKMNECLKIIREEYTNFRKENKLPNIDKEYKKFVEWSKKKKVILEKHHFQINNIYQYRMRLLRTLFIIKKRCYLKYFNYISSMSQKRKMGDKERDEFIDIINYGIESGLCQQRGCIHYFKKTRDEENEKMEDYNSKIVSFLENGIDYEDFFNHYENHHPEVLEKIIVCIRSCLTYSCIFCKWKSGAKKRSPVTYHLNHISKHHKLFDNKLKLYNLCGKSLEKEIESLMFLREFRMEKEPDNLILKRNSKGKLDYFTYTGKFKGAHLLPREGEHILSSPYHFFKLYIDNYASELTSLINYNIKRENRKKKSEIRETCNMEIFNYIVIEFILKGLRRSHSSYKMIEKDNNLYNCDYLIRVMKKCNLDKCRIEEVKRNFTKGKEQTIRLNDIVNRTIKKLVDFGFIHVYDEGFPGYGGEKDDSSSYCPFKPSIRGLLNYSACEIESYQTIDKRWKLKNIEGGKIVFHTHIVDVCGEIISQESISPHPECPFYVCSMYDSAFGSKKLATDLSKRRCGFVGGLKMNSDFSKAIKFMAKGIQEKEWRTLSYMVNSVDESQSLELLEYCAKNKLKICRMFHQNFDWKWLKDLCCRYLPEKDIFLSLPFVSKNFFKFFKKMHELKVIKTITIMVICFRDKKKNKGTCNMVTNLFNSEFDFTICKGQIVPKVIKEWNCVMYAVDQRDFYQAESENKQKNRVSGAYCRQANDISDLLFSSYRAYLRYHEIDPNYVTTGSSAIYGYRWFRERILEDHFDVPIILEMKDKFTQTDKAQMEYVNEKEKATHIAEWVGPNHSDTNQYCYYCKLVNKQSNSCINYCEDCDLYFHCSKKNCFSKYHKKFI